MGSSERMSPLSSSPLLINDALIGALWRRVIRLVATRVSRMTLTKLYTKFATQNRPRPQQTRSYRDWTHPLPVGNLVRRFASQESEHDVG